MTGKNKITKSPFAFFAKKAPLIGKRDRSYLTWAFILPFSFMLLFYLLDGVFPFGGNSVLVLDLSAQYVGFYEALRAFIYGDGSMLYSFARSLGGEMMGIYAYYIASPLSYLIALFPRENITEALLFIFVLKAGLCGLTFGIYLDRHGYAKPRETVLFSTLYALSSFAIVMQNNSMWIDNLILLPLLTLGIERLVKHRRFGLYVVTLALALLSNFYIGYMTCIYTLLYFLYYSYGYNRKGENNPLGEKQHYLRSLLRMALYSAIAVGIAAIIILTTLYSLSFGKNTFTDPDFTPHLQFNPIDFFVKLLPGVYDTVEPEGFPFVYCGALTLLLCPLYFLNRRFARGERIATGVLLATFYISMSVSTLDMLWHGGQAPNWLNYRYSFFLCFLLLVLASRAFCRLGDVSLRQILSTAVVLLVLIAVAFSMNYTFFSGGIAIVAAIFILVITALLAALRRYGKESRSFFTALLALVVLAEVFYNGNVQIARLHENVGGTDRAEYRDYIDRMRPLIDYLDEFDSGFYRTETTSHRLGALNDAMALGYRGVTNSTSTLNAKTIQFLHRMGLLAKDHWSRYEGSTLTLDSLLGIKYLVTTSTRKPHEQYPQLEDAPAFIYQNPYALPIAYAVSERLAELQLSSINEPLARQNAMLGAMLGGDAAAIYLPIQPTKETHDKVAIDYIEDHDGALYTEIAALYYLENKQAIESGALPEDEIDIPEGVGVTWEVTVKQDGPLYFYIPTEYPAELKLTVNGLYDGTVFGDEEDFVKNLGKFKAGDTVTVSIRLTDETLVFYYKTDATLFYQEDSQTAAIHLQALGQNGMTVTQYTEDSFIGNITTTDERPTVLTTIPYDAGWIVTVDGEAVETYETLDALLAFDTTPGAHEVEMVYRPVSYVSGRAISLISLALFVLLLTLDLLLRHGILKPKAGGAVDKILSVFFCYGISIPLEANYLADEYMPLPPPKLKREESIIQEDSTAETIHKTNKEDAADGE